MNDIHILDFVRIDTIKILTLTTSLSHNQVKSPCNPWAQGV
jgi:hypothetical protein